MCFYMAKKKRKKKVSSVCACVGERNLIKSK